MNPELSLSIWLEEIIAALALSTILKIRRRVKRSRADPYGWVHTAPCR